MSQPLGHPTTPHVCVGQWGQGRGPVSVACAARSQAVVYVQDDQPRAFTLPPDAQSPGTLDVPVGPRRRECTVPLAPNFTANNRCAGCRATQPCPPRAPGGGRFVLFVSGPGCLGTFLWAGCLTLLGPRILIYTKGIMVVFASQSQED